MTNVFIFEPLSFISLNKTYNNISKNLYYIVNADTKLNVKKYRN